MNLQLGKSHAAPVYTGKYCRKNLDRQKVVAFASRGLRQLGLHLGGQVGSLALGDPSQLGKRLRFPLGGIPVTPLTVAVGLVDD